MPTPKITQVIKWFLYKYCRGECGFCILSVVLIWKVIKKWASIRGTRFNLGHVAESLPPAGTWYGVTPEVGEPLALKGHGSDSLPPQSFVFRPSAVCYDSLRRNARNARPGN